MKKMRTRGLAFTPRYESNIVIEKSMKIWMEIFQ